ncbi:MAG: SprT family zinc-dependent metalloprotease [Victivallaceae bacterium]|nr:SprT family zinc-dependent metalloprotease [Victivallaceae bacterium]
MTIPAQYSVVRSRRRTSAVEVRNGRVILRLPTAAPPDAADRLFRRYEKWIAAKLEEQKTRQAPPELKLEFGVKLPLLGMEYLLKVGVRRGFDRAFYLTGDDGDNLPEALRKLYRRLAADFLRARLDFLAKQYNISYTGLRISGARRRWGSCSAQGSIILNWRLLMLEEALCDCVICHELAHRTVMNHSPDFYRRFDELCPERRSLEPKLKSMRFLPDDGWK